MIVISPFSCAVHSIQALEINVIYSWVSSKDMTYNLQVGNVFHNPKNIKVWVIIVAELRD